MDGGLLSSRRQAELTKSGHSRPAMIVFLVLRLHMTVLLAAMCPSWAGAADTPNFTRDIRPILSNFCFRCHGPDEESRMADLRLDLTPPADEQSAAHRVIQPFQPAESELLRRIQSLDPEVRMPPADSGLELSPEQVETLHRWIAHGAPVEQHWAFRPIVRPPLPDVSSSWPQNSIDHFILSRLNDAGIRPSPMASRHVLIRRVALDLLGLPPSVDDVDHFVQDSSGSAIAAMVERTLASPHYGERWGRHWLDQARYADTNGYTIDSERSLWPYRDWVIRALNDDLPFDQFTIEQLAGDLLPDPALEQLVATGFHRNTLINEEGGTDDEQFRNEAVVDRVNTTGAVWLGLTLGCAQCHTHKYDPITQQEYYQLFAYFNNSRDVNTVDPTILVPNPEQEKQLAELEIQIQAAAADVSSAKKQRHSAESAGAAEGQAVNWNVVTFEKTSSVAGAVFRPLEDGSLLTVSESGPTEEYRLKFRVPGKQITGIRLEALTHPTLPANGPGRSDNGTFLLNELKLEAVDASGERRAAKWIHATADYSHRDYPVSDAVDGQAETGWSIDLETGNRNVNRTAVFTLTELPVSPDTEIHVTLQFNPRPPMANLAWNLGRFRLSVTDAPHSALDVPDAAQAALLARQNELETARRTLTGRIAKTLIMSDREQPRQTHLLIRGDFLRQGKAVEPGIPEIFGLAISQQQPNRLQLAQWLVDHRNPLTARVTVNRIWARYFGQGLVETENDFGLQGTPPTHPELLDWLAAELMDSGWSLKHVHRLILNSATYQQQSDQRPDLQQQDPQNRLLARQSRLRVDAEIVRDLGLAVSGLLHPKIGGPGVYPPQPDGLYAFTQRSAAWPVSEGADRYRRGMYTFYMRSAPYPMLSTFDTPRFNTTCTIRVRSNTPLQSLTMANDATMLEMAQALGKRLRQHDPGVVDRIDEDGVDADAGRLIFAWRLCLVRPPEPAELDIMTRYLQQQRNDFSRAPDDAVRVAGHDPADPVPADAVDAAAWTMVARAVLNLDEFIVRE